jgi:hypothetical protein
MFFLDCFGRPSPPLRGGSGARDDGLQAAGFAPKPTIRVTLNPNDKALQAEVARLELLHAIQERTPKGTASQVVKYIKQGT